MLFTIVINNAKKSHEFPNGFRLIKKDNDYYLEKVKYAKFYYQFCDDIKNGGYKWTGGFRYLLSKDWEFLNGSKGMLWLGHNKILMFIDKEGLLRGTRFIRGIIRSIDEYNSTAFRLADPKISSIFNWDDQLICEPVSCTFNDTVTNCELKLCKFNAVSN